MPQNRLLLGVVPTPMTASGAVSGGDLERYVRWFRGADVDGVLLWTMLGGGDYLDAAEREELYSVWRSGLLPHQQVWVEVPAGQSAITHEAIRFQAAHARELGVDGIVTSTAAEADVKPIAGQLALWIRNGAGNSEGEIDISLAAALKLPARGEDLFPACGAQELSAVVLGALEERKIISAAGSCSPNGIRCTDLIEPELRDLVSRLASHIP